MAQKKTKKSMSTPFNRNTREAVKPSTLPPQKVKVGTIQNMKTLTRIFIEEFPRATTIRH